MRDPRHAFRTQVLESCSASPGILDELLAYGDQPCVGSAAPDFPLPDEPHVDSWAAYAREARVDGAVDALKRHLVQLKFPVRAGVSQEDAYRDATRKGRVAAADAFVPGLTLAHPEHVELAICPTMAGRVPVIVAGDREDFVALVQALTDRNEPVPVPAAVGACIVKGLNNWSRVAAYRERWTRETGEASDAEWAAEFQRLIPRKDQYQDRLIILSRGPYSAIAAGDVGVDEAEWLDRSLVIRREHEFAHYFTYRVFGVLRSHVFDELIADFVGFLCAFGHYRGDLALRCLGLESFPQCRPGGRLAVYLAQSGLSDEAGSVVRSLAFRSVRNLEALDQAQRTRLQDLAGLGRLTFGLSQLTLEELASDALVDLVAARLG